jgi:hypothetical protein
MMKRTHKKEHNISVIKLFDDVAKHCKSKRAKVVLKNIIKRPEMALLTSMSGVLSHYLDVKQDEVNILVYQAKNKDIIDHGRWLVLIAYLLKNPDLSINVWLNPVNDSEDDVTNLRPLVDFIIDNFHQGKVKTHLVKGSFKELVHHIGMDKLDLIYNHNPTIQDHNTFESRECLHQCIKNGVRYVIAESTPVTLLFKLAIFEVWGISTSDGIYNNPYFVTLQKGVSSQYRYMGHAISLDTVIDEQPELIDADTHSLLDTMANSIIQCVNVGENLHQTPKKAGSIVNIFSNAEFNTHTNVFKCSHSGDTVTIKLDDVADFPSEALTTEISLDVARVSWGLVIYARYLTELSRVKTLRKKAVV